MELSWFCCCCCMNESIQQNTFNKQKNFISSPLYGTIEITFSALEIEMISLTQYILYLSLLKCRLISKHFHYYIVTIQRQHSTFKLWTQNPIKLKWIFLPSLTSDEQRNRSRAKKQEIFCYYMIISLHVNKIIFEKRNVNEIGLDCQSFNWKIFVEWFYWNVFRCEYIFFFYSFSNQCSNIAKKKSKNVEKCK